MKGNVKASTQKGTVPAPMVQSSVTKALDDEDGSAFEVDQSEYEGLSDYADLPLESVLDSESSDGFAVGDSEGEKEVDRDYVMNEDELSDAEAEKLFILLSERRAKKKVSKPQVIVDKL